VDPGELAHLLRRLEDLEARLKRLEERAAPFTPYQPPASASMPSPPTPPAERWARSYREQHAAGVSAESPPARPPVRPGDAPPTSRQATAKPLADSYAPPDLERRIGARLFAWGGAIVVVIGLALFLMYAYREGWLGLLTPAVRCFAGAGLGVVLLAAGEVARRRINATASAGLSAAGVGAMYASAYAAHAMFALIGKPGAMGLLAAVAALGVIVSAASGLASVAILSVIGAYIAPVLLGGSDTSPLFLPVYVLVLQAASCIVAHWRGRSGVESLHSRGFEALRSVAWWGTALLGAYWIIDTARGDLRPAALVFLGAFWAITHADRVLWAWRLEPAADEDRSLRRRIHIDPRLLRPLSSSISTTALAVSGGIWIAQEWGAFSDWLVPGVACAATLVLGVLQAGHIRLFHDRPRTVREALGACLGFQALALLLITLGLALTGWAQALAWMGLGLAAIAFARAVESRPLDYYGLIALGAGTARVWLGFALPDPGVDQVLMEQWGLVVTVGSLRAIISAAAWVAAGALLLVRNNARMPGRAIFAAFVGVLLFLPALSMGSASYASVIAAWCAIALAAALGSLALPRLRLGHAGIVALVITAVLWLVQLETLGALSGRMSGTPLGLAPYFWTAILLAASAIVVWHIGIPRLSEDRVPLGFAVLAASILVFFIASSLEVARGAQMFVTDETIGQAALSFYWGLFGVALIGAGFWRRIAPARIAGLLLMVVATAKALVFDLTEVTLGWRALAVLGLGLLMLGVGVAYVWVSRRMDGTAAGEGSSTAEPA